MQDAQYTAAKAALIAAGWTVVSVCSSCGGNVVKFRSGRYYIRIFKSTGTATLSFGNSTVTGHVKLEKIQELVQRVISETAGIPAK